MKDYLEFWKDHLVAFGWIWFWIGFGVASLLTLVFIVYCQKLGSGW